MASTDNQFENQHPRTQFRFVPPQYTLGFLIIVQIVTIVTAFGILSEKYADWQADGYKIIDENEWTRIITSPFAVSSFLDVFFMLLSFIWLFFTLTYYQRNYSTVYTLYHFVYANICIVLGVSGLYWVMFYLTGMKNFIMNVGGIFPYSLFMYLKSCLQKPGEVINHWFLPFPVNRWFMGFLVTVVTTFTVPQSQGCLIVFFDYLFCSFLVFLKHITRVRCFYRQGPLCNLGVRIVEKLIPNFIKSKKGFCSIQQCQKKRKQIQTQEDRRQQLQQEAQIQQQQS